MPEDERATRPTTMTTSPGRAGAWIIVLAAVAFLGVVCTFGFTNAEDQGLITENPNLNPPTLRGLWNHWREPHVFLYIPATYTAWWLVAQVARTATPDETGATLNPWLFHALNLSLHATSAVLVLHLLRRLIGRDGPAVVGALVFALHPIQVEPAAWTTGTKDVLCGVWSFAALLLYVKFAQGRVGCATDPSRPAGAEPGESNESRAALGNLAESPSKSAESRAAGGWIYALATVCLVIALLSKPAASVVPFMALVIDVVLLRMSWRSVLARALPWFAIAIPFALIARAVQPVEGVTPAPLWARPLIAADALAFYLWKIVWPFGLTIEYARSPRWLIETGAIRWTWVIPLAVALMIGLSRRRVLVASGLLFVAGLLPVLGLTTFLYQRFSTVADRFVYLSMFALALAAAWTVGLAWSRRTAAACGVLLVLLGARSTVQAMTWRNRVTLYGHAVKVTPHSVVAHNNYGSGLWRSGDAAGAEREFREALRLDPGDAGARSNLNLVLRARGSSDTPE